MKINRNLIASIAITALVIGGVAATQLKSDEAISTKVAANNIWTYDCEIPVQLPESFLLTCGDGGMVQPEGRVTTVLQVGEACCMQLPACVCTYPAASLSLWVLLPSGRAMLTGGLTSTTCVAGRSAPCGTRPGRACGSGCARRSHSPSPPGRDRSCLAAARSPA